MLNQEDKLLIIFPAPDSNDQTWQRESDSAIDSPGEEFHASA